MSWLHLTVARPPQVGGGLHYVDNQLCIEYVLLAISAQYESSLVMADNAVEDWSKPVCPYVHHDLIVAV